MDAMGASAASRHSGLDGVLLTRAGRRSFWLLEAQAEVLAVAIYLLMGAAFVQLQAHAMAALEFGSALYHLGVVLLLRRKHNRLAVTLQCAHLVVHPLVAVPLLGWNSGFAYPLFLMVPVIFVSTLGNRLKTGLALGVCLLYMGLDALMTVLPPLSPVSPPATHLLRYLNIGATFSFLAFLAWMYFGLVARAEGQLLEAASTDPLTRLFNRRHLLELAAYEISRTREPARLSFVLCDVDHFKGVNDSHGHEAGDRTLQHVANVLRSCARGTDSVCRWGGEEFLLLLADTDVAGAVRLAERIRTGVAGSVVMLEPTLPLQVTVTLGVSMHRPGERVEACIARADAALYRGKAAGRNRVEADIGMADAQGGGNAAEPAAALRETS